MYKKIKEQYFYNKYQEYQLKVICINLRTFLLDICIKYNWRIMVDNKDKEREELKKAIKNLLSKPRKSEIPTYNKEFLEDYRKILVEPKITESQKIGIDALKTDNMTDFVLAVSRIAQVTADYVDLGCINAESTELAVECNIGAKKLRAGALNILTEALVEKCDGKMTYIIRD